MENINSILKKDKTKQALSYSDKQMLHFSGDIENLQIT